jgi:signal transduction histidine kinase
LRYGTQRVAAQASRVAYDHGEGAIELRAALRDQRLLIEVVDEGEGAAIEVREAARDGRGRGLRIVDGLAESWGAYEGTTHVWAELPLGL